MTSLTSLELSQSYPLKRLNVKDVWIQRREPDSLSKRTLREHMGTENGENPSVSAADRAIGVPRVGVGVVVLNSKNQVLIGKRKSPHGQGTWSLPGGHLEFFEGFEECGRREVLEETNLVLDDVKFVSAENNFFPNGSPQRHYVTICLSGRAVHESQLVNTEPEKCEGWEWVSAADLIDDTKGYRPLFVPLKHIFVTMGLTDS